MNEDNAIEMNSKAPKKIDWYLSEKLRLERWVEILKEDLALIEFHNASIVNSHFSLSTHTAEYAVKGLKRQSLRKLKRLKEITTELRKVCSKIKELSNE